MKTSAVILLSIVAAASAFNVPLMATRAVGKTKAAPVKKVVAKKVVAKKTITNPFAKKVVAKKVVAKKVVAKKVVAKKVVAKKVVAKKVVAKKVAAKKVVAKKVVAKKVVAKKAVKGKAPAKAKATPKARAAPPASQGYPSFAEAAMSFKLPNISGGGNKASTFTLITPDFSNPKLNIERDPAFYAAAAKQRLVKKIGSFVIDDGLTILERQQRTIAPSFLTGSANSRADVSTINADVVGDEFLFGLNADRFQLLFITVFGVFTLVGALSGRLNL